jgi:hypothetical protein
MKKNFNLKYTLAIAAILSLGTILSGCSSRPSVYGDDDWDGTYVATNDTAICVDSKTGKRLPDNQCKNTRSYNTPIMWYYMSSGSRIPYYGERAYGGSFRTTKGRSYYTTPKQYSNVRSSVVSSHKSVVTARGGFGSTGRSFSSGS